MPYAKLGGGEGGTKRLSTEELEGSGNALHNTVMTLHKPTEHTTPRVNANVSCGLEGIMTCPCTLINCNKCATLEGVLIMKEPVRVLGQGVYGTAVLSPQFCSEPKITLKR